MTLLQKISTQLKKDKSQRLLYGMALIVWSALWIDNIELFPADSSFGIKNYWIIAIPTFILIGQILFNSSILWWLTVGLISTYTIWTVWNIVFLKIILDYHRDYVHGSIWNFNEILSLSTIFLTLILINWTTWKMRPEKNKNSLHNPT